MNTSINEYIENDSIKIPKIGMRIVKSALAVLLCFAVNLLRGGAGIVFYSQLSALWCIQMYRSKTKNNALQRTIGTAVGALFGLAYLILYINVLQGIAFEEGVEAVIISLMIIGVLYTTVVLNKTQSSYFSCVVFLSIVINHVADVNPFYFVWNRFLDTMIGIIIGVGINNIRICPNPDRDTLFISGLDDTLLDKENELSSFSKVELNRMIDDGLKFTVSTMRTPASIYEAIGEVKLKLPVIAMDGAVLFDTNTNSYLRSYVISASESNKLMGLILEANISWYANVIIDDLLVIYYGNTDDQANVRLLEDYRSSLFRNYVNRPLPENENVTYYMLLDTDDLIKAFYEKLENEGYTEKLKIITYKSHDYPGYSYIKIYNKNATKDNMINYLKQTTGLKNVVTFGTIPGKYDYIIHNNDANEVVKKVRGLYEPLLGIRLKKKMPKQEG